MELLNSPLSFIIFILVWIPVLWIMKKKYGKNRCKVCGKGYMQEMQAVPEGIMHATTSQGMSTTTVTTKVKYQCTECKEFVVALESR